jgi:hypothetical protein
MCSDELFHELLLFLRNFLIKMETLNETLWKVWMKGGDTGNNGIV